MRRALKIALRILLGLAGLSVIALVTGILVVRTDWFKNKVREKIVSVSEKATGGRVEIGKFNYNWPAMTAEVEPFVLHGSEPASAQPFFRATKIQVGLRIISALQKDVDIASLTVEGPQVNVIVLPDGSTNVPKPKVPPRSERNFAEQLLDLKVRRFELREGYASYNSERFPLDIRGERLHLSFVYEAAGPRYVGEISSKQVRISSPATKEPFAFDLYSKLALEGNAVQVFDTSASSAGLNLKLKGSITGLSSPRGIFDIAAALPMKELNRSFGLPLASTGGLSFEGKGSIESSPFRYRLEGRLKGRGLAYAYRDAVIPDIALAARLEATPDRIDLSDLDLSALHGRFRGSAQVADLKRLTVQGTAESISLTEIANLANQETGELNGIASGTVHVDATIARPGLTGVIADATMDIVPGNGGVPVQGAVAIHYDQRAGKVRMDHSELSLGSTHAVVSGTLGETLAVQASTNNFDDLLPLAPLFGGTAPEQLPVALRGGSASFDGVVTGPLSNPRISGKADLTHLALDRREFDHVASNFDIDKDSATLRSLIVEQGKMRVDGQGRISLRNWKVEESSGISGQFSVRGADIHKLLADNGSDAPVAGSLAATLRVSGTFESPLLTGNVDASNVTAYGEHFDQARGEVTYTATALEVSDGELRSGPARIAGAGAYNHPGNEWSDGSLRFDVATTRLNLMQINHVQELRKGLAGDVDLKASGTVKVVKGVIALTSLNGQLALRNAIVDGRSYGTLDLTANTRLPVLTLAASVNSSGIQLRGSGEWRMEGDYQGRAHVQIPQLSFAVLHDLAPGEHLRKDLPFDGFLEGEATLSGPLNNLEAMKADVTLSRVQLSAGPNVHPPPGTKREDLILKNSQPVRLEGNWKSIDIRSADFEAKETKINASGRLALDSRNPWDLSVKGSINLSILQIFNPDLLAAGVSILNLGVRGPLSEPQVDGRLELKNASLFLKDLPNGVDQANGLILFDRNRATVQTLSAVTGGGTVTFEPGSFVGFRGMALFYGLKATARNVRYRSVEGISVTASANLSLSGTSESSVLSGSVVVERARFNPRTDVGSLLAATAKPVAVTSTPNEYLRGIQFDVGLATGRSLDIETSLTRNIQADADLRLRGTPERPMLLGNVTVGSGEIEFFGNKYTINRGQLNFYNPARIEPIIDMDLETKVRSITVDISFSGPLNKLNFSYRSDPPLETSEIIALLAVGRAPSTSGPLASSQTVASTNYLATGSNALLGQAIAPVSGRLQRLFGVSHIKIDPQLTDITSIPQARLTLEQQVSTDITLTYITNLSVTNRQIVRVQWDFSRQWSAVALRDENGAFSIDFQYRKRFK